MSFKEAWIVPLFSLIACNIMIVWGACPPGWTRYRDSCYNFVHDQQPWANAVKNCTSMATNAHLVIVESDMENDFLVQVLLQFAGGLPPPIKLEKSLYNLNVVNMTLNPIQFNYAAGNWIQFWMDGTDMDAEGTWIWEHTRDPFEVKHFQPGEPNQNGGEEDCLAFFGRYNYTWNDEHCSSLEPYICEVEDPLPDTGVVG